MDTGEERKDTFKVNIGGGVSGQVAVGKNISQSQVRSSGVSAVSEVELAELEKAFAELQALVEQQSPPEQKNAALERVRELKEAVTEEKPDLTTMEYVKKWFGKNLPKVAGAVGSIVVHPIVGRLVEAAGDTLVDEFKQRFGEEE